MVRDSIMRALRGFERLLLLLGLTPSSASIAWFTRMRQFENFGAIRKPPSTGPATSFSRISGSRIFGFGRPSALNLSDQRNHQHPSPFGVLRIPSIEIEVPVLEGTDDLTLNRAVGHIDGTAAPGEEGNIGMPDTGTDFSAGSRTFTSASTWICTLNGETRVTSWTTSASFHRRTFQYLRHARDLPSHS